MEENTPASNTDLSLSAAILAPLNAIFEAQVHAARSFLSFILQMGFRHKYSESEKEALRKNPEGNKDILDQLNQEERDKEIIRTLKTRRNQGEILNDDELSQLKNLMNKWDELRSLDFNYIDEEANEHLISIPNLALIPVKPLAIDDASFKFEMAVNHSRDFNTIRKNAKVDTKRPWFLVQPKQLTGNIISKEQASKQASISVEINIKSTEMPAGLGKLLASMNESSRIIPASQSNENQS